ncbi:MAG: hypothetical protein A2571_01205 [Candidatus Vogelbacteria bacterium RIFOXYD1_FULL_44_32]|uniref:Uncharacterized protein n=1 Tax=Candidatus Vogelbacteria bacterium RIFOXYD1_FULL_44_32 TaxID=1802438 RepID=A0A1G2QER9_9BACT|nr:MAG: hypothetical protein A2571_01205 [Candidatus Vogelbacteria bacterium RIFOXYD1_FULL_44_32]
MGVVLLICIIYAGFKMTALIKGPAIEILSPTAGNIYASELVVVKGKVERITKIYMNDRQIFTDNEGHFSEPLLLFSGYNILTLKATDAFGRKVSKQIELIYQG